MKGITPSKPVSPVFLSLKTQVNKQTLEFNPIDPANIKYSFKNHINHRGKEEALRILTNFLDEEEKKTANPLRRTKIKIAENLKEIFSLNSSLIPSARAELIDLISEENVLILETGTNAGVFHKPLGLLLCENLCQITKNPDNLLSDKELNELNYIIDKSSLELRKASIKENINYYLKAINSIKKNINSHLILIPSTPEAEKYINRLQSEYSSYKNLIEFYKKHDVSNNYLTTELFDLMMQIELEFKNVGALLEYDFDKSKASKAGDVLSSRIKDYVAVIKEERKMKNY